MLRRLLSARFAKRKKSSLDRALLRWMQLLLASLYHSFLNRVLLFRLQLSLFISLEVRDNTMGDCAVLFFLHFCHSTKLCRFMQQNVFVSLFWFSLWMYGVWRCFILRFYCFSSWFSAIPSFYMHFSGSLLVMTCNEVNGVFVRSFGQVFAFLCILVVRPNEVTFSSIKLCSRRICMWLFVSSASHRSFCKAIQPLIQSYLRGWRTTWSCCGC